MENGPGLKMYFLLKMGISHGYVSLPEGIFVRIENIYALLCFQCLEVGEVWWFLLEMRWGKLRYHVYV